MAKEFDDFALVHPRDYFAPLTALLQADVDLTGKVVLEFGCGTGAWILSLEELSAKSVAGIDISAEAIKAAQQAAKKKGHSAVRFLNADISRENVDLPPPDLIISHSVLQYVVDLEQVVRRLFSLLAAGGRIFVTLEKKSRMDPLNWVQWFNFLLVPVAIRRRFHYIIRILLPDAARKNPPEVLEAKSRYLGIPAVQFLTAGRLKKVFEAAGFQEVSVSLAPGLDPHSVPHYLIRASKP
ncbi:MAG: hypothetical protein A2428_16340 [Bdellovibrionales bacterium RIFOXYC1_FULL_54_43]|nr:MAG: hypothetical protein A2428_16340 [Bdellovibrionales bacterium RIFOXYC1_FULL_54_43]OFZ83964.1 MAG: hypothetical protein A2603_10455 [Bdellovibrionales bacterium RIFOXYD1_FULL_55_31]